MKRNRHKMVKKICENCGKEFDAQEYRLRQGLERFCSKACNYEWKRNNRVWGKKNGKRYFNGGRWIYQWFTQDGKAHNTSFAKYLWEENFGKVPKGYAVRHKDGDINNFSLDNLYLDTIQEVMRKVSHLGARSFSAEMLRKMSEMKKGDKSPSWRGGKAGEEYPPEFHRARIMVLERDHYHCRLCHSDNRVLVHHVDADKKNNCLDNLMTVCSGCHGKIHSPKKSKDPAILTLQGELYRNSH